MRLTQNLLFFVRRRHIPGAIYSGKNRIHPSITNSMKKKAIELMIVEQENLDLLNNPYLTREETAFHMVDSGKYKERIDRLREENINSKMMKHKLMANHLDHLNVCKKWE